MIRKLSSRVLFLSYGLAIQQAEERENDQVADSDNYWVEGRAIAGMVSKPANAASQKA